MNANRRKQVSKVIEQLNAEEATLRELLNTLDSIKSDEEDYRDNIPENLQSSERYERADAAADNLYEACNNLEELVDLFEGIVECLEEASE